MSAAARVGLCVALLLAAARAQEPRDPWTDADDELGRSGAAAALALAKRAQAPAPLRDYLESSPPAQPELRAAFEKAREFDRARRFGDVIALLAPLELKEGTLLEARLWGLQAFASWMQRREDPQALERGLYASRQADAIAERLGWPNGRRRALDLASKLLLALQDFEGLADVHGKLAGVCQHLGEEKPMHGHRLDRAASLVGLGRLREALEVLPASIEAAARNGWKGYEAAGRDNLATALWQQGDYASALYEVERAERLWSELVRDGPEDQRPSFVEHQANNAMVRAVILQELGDFEAAGETLRSLQRRIEEDQGAFHPFFGAAVKGNLGVVAWRRGEHERALQLLRASLQDFQALPGYGNECAMARRDIAEVLIDAGRPGEALPHLDRALEGFGNDPLARAATLAIQADAHERLGHPGRAEALVDAALDIEDAACDRRTRNRLFEIRARVLLARDKPREAVASLRKSLDLVEDAVSGLSDEETFAAREQRARLFQVAVESAFRWGDPDAILEALERSRAAVLREAIGNRRALYRAALSTVDADALHAAEQDVVEARLRLLGALKQPKAQPVLDARGALGRAEEDLRQLADRAQREHKRLAGAVQTRPVGLDDIKSRLEAGEVLVYYALDGRECRAFRVTRKEARAFPLGDAAGIRALCDAAGATFMGDVATLRDALVAPLELPDAARVIVCPDGPLSYLAWPEVLGERYASTVPSGTTLALLRDRSAGRGRGVLAFGDPDYAAAAAGEAPASRDRLVRLLHARAEVEAVAGGEQDACRVGKQATEAQLRADIGGAKRWRAVHFACHGVVDRRSPRRSALALTPGGDDDGFLTLPEIMALDVKADLVVLSACDSGTGGFVRGEGVVGLARAFLVAGTPTVVASLWKVDDAATKDLMVAFHRHLARGVAPAAALRAAQGELRKERKDPRDWAAWVIWGLPGSGAQER